MEDKQLNFNQPLLSVRRCGPTLIQRETDARKIDHSFPVVPLLHPHRAELKSGPITNPGSVPFLWERTPGRPKQEFKSQDRSIDVVPVGPKLPPGRYPKAKYPQGRDNVFPTSSGSENQAVNIPSSSGSKGEVIYVPCNGNVKTVADSREATDKEESCDSVDGDGTYVDALDSFSRTESFSLNCSMSELDNLDVKPYGNFRMDPQNREFMMDRFLPAARAMASEMPHHAPRKQPIVEEKQQQLKQIINHNKPSLRYGPSYTKQYSHYNDNVALEEESDDECDHRGNLPAACGLLPQFCLKGSLGRLNPVPSISVRTRGPMFSSRKGQPCSSLVGSCSPTDKECMSDTTEVKPTGMIQIAELDEGKTESGNDIGQLESHSTSTYCSAPSSIPEDKGVHSSPEETSFKDLRLHGKGSKTFHELLAEQDGSEESDVGGHVVEKTLYVDTVQRVESPNLRSFSPNKQNRYQLNDTSTEEGHEIVNERMDQRHKTDPLAADLEKLDDQDGKEKLLPNAYTFADLIAFPSSDTHRKEKPLAFRGNPDSNIDPSATKTFEQPKDKETKGLEKQLKRATTLIQSHQNHSQHAASPPLPKSPSDSWLCRTLPPKSRRNPTLRSYLGATKNPQNHGSRALATDTKWETLVKATKVEHRQLPHSEGLLKAIPET